MKMAARYGYVLGLKDTEDRIAERAFEGTEAVIGGILTFTIPFCMPYFAS